MILSKKIVLLGYFGVGKSSIIRKFVSNSFSTDYKVTIGVHILKKEVKINNTDTISLIIWDLEGTDSIELINKAYLLGTHCFIYVYDLTRAQTFKDLAENTIKLKDISSKALVKIVGNKADLLTESQIVEHQEFIKDRHYLSSAKTGKNIELLFHDIAKELNT